MTKEMEAKIIIHRLGREYGLEEEENLVRIGGERMIYDSKSRPHLYLDGMVLSEMQGHGNHGWSLSEDVRRELSEIGLYFEWETYSIMTIHNK